MAKSFNLTAQINLQGPTNIKPVVAQIKRELGAVNTDINIKFDPKAAKGVDSLSQKIQILNRILIETNKNSQILSSSLNTLGSSIKGLGTLGKVNTTVSKTASSIRATAKATKTASSEMVEFGKQSALAIRRFAAFSVVGAGVYSLVNAIKSGTKAFIEFDKQLIKLQQITGSGNIGIKLLRDEIINLATTLGVSSESLTEVASTLAQAGFSARETQQALAALAKTELAPSFDNLTDTTEGAIAAIRQFGIETQDLEKVLGSINAVAAAFAVESSDIITAIQRAGGAFAASSKGVSEGADALNEFIAIFTSVRATTRESAETIATGLRTIFTRIQRGSTVKFLREFGVELTDIEGKFVGPYEAIKRLSAVLNTLDPRDLRFSQIVEELGGFRQISKVIPLIQQFADAEKALGVAQRGQGSLSEAQVKAQQSLANQLARVREEFLALTYAIGDSATFRGLFKLVLGLTSGLLKLTSVFKPLLPLLATLGVIKGGQALTKFGSGFLSGIRKGGGAGGVGTNLGESLSGANSEKTAIAAEKTASALTDNTKSLTTLTDAVKSLTQAINSRGPGTTLNSGGKVMAFARGGTVPGSGNRDTVPAMLMPGEFVIRKKAVEKLGADNLHKMNKYADGGTVNITAKELLNRSKGSQSIKNLIRDDADPSAYRSGQSINTEDNISFIRNAYKLYEPKLVNDPSGFEDAVATKTNGTRTNYGKNDPNFPIDITGSNFGPLEVRNRNRSTSNRTLLDKLIRYYLSSNQTKRLSNEPKADSISLGKLGIVYNSAKYDPPNAKALNKGGLIQKFLRGGTVEETATLENMSVQDSLIAWLKELGGIQGVKDISGIAGNDRTLDSALRVNNIKSGGAKLQTAIQAINKALSNKTAKRAREAQSINKAIKLAIVGLEPLGFSDDRVFDTGFGKAALLLRGLPNDPMYADLIPQMRAGVGQLSTNLATGLQAATAFGGNQPIALDFDETLVKGADIFGPDGKPDIPAYDDLNRVKEALKNGQPTELAQKLKSILDFDPSFIDRIRILTARPQESANLLAEKLNSIGLPIPASKIQGTRGGGATKASKLGVVEKLIDDNYDNVIAAIAQGKTAKQYAELREIQDAEQRAGGIANAEGAILQLALSKLGAQGGTIKEAAVDFEKGLGLQASQVFGLPPDIPTEVKRTLSSAAIGRAEEEFTRYFKENYGPFSKGSDVYSISKTTGLPVSRFANGGSSQDTVPALLTPGEFVINKKAAQKIGYGKLHKLNKADKLQGYNKGGVVGFVQKFAAGGDVKELFSILAEQAGQSIKEFESEIKTKILESSLSERSQRQSSRLDFRKGFTKTKLQYSQGDMRDLDVQDEIRKSLQESLSGLLDPSEINGAIDEIIYALGNGTTALEDIAKISPEVAKALDATIDKSESLAKAHKLLEDELGGLTDSVKVAAAEMEAFDYKKSGKAQQEFGLLGNMSPGGALAFKNSRVGSRLLGAAQNFQQTGGLGKLPIIGKGIGGLSKALENLPGPIGSAVRAVGGLPGAFAAVASIIGSEFIPMLLKAAGAADSEIGAGIGGALAQGGSMGASLGALGNQIAGPIGGMIGTIGGAVAGAIKGFSDGIRTKALENALKGLTSQIENVDKAFEYLAKNDNTENLIRAQKETVGLQDSINKLAEGIEPSMGQRAADAGYYGTLATVGTFLAGLGLVVGGTALVGTSGAATVGTVGAAAPLGAVGATAGGYMITAGGAMMMGAPAVGTGVGVGAAALNIRDDINDESLQGHLKAVTAYVEGISKLAERDIKLKNLDQLDAIINKINNINIDLKNGKITPEQADALKKQEYIRLGQQSSAIEQAQRGALMRATNRYFDPNQDLNAQIGDDQNLRAIANAAADTTAYNLALAELSRKYDANTEAGRQQILKEKQDKNKLIERGYELAGMEEYQAAVAQRLAIISKQVAIETENLVEAYNKALAGIGRFKDELENTVMKIEENAGMLTGEGGMGRVDRTQEQMLRNMSAYTAQELAPVLETVQSMAGGGEQGKKLSDSIKASQVMQQVLPGLLRNTTGRNVSEVTNQLEEQLAGAGIGEEVRKALVKEVEQYLEKETGNRSGDSFQEVLANFPALADAIDTAKKAQEVGIAILEAQNDALDAVNQQLDQYNKYLRQSLQWSIKADQIRLQGAIELDRALGRDISLERLNKPFENEIKALTQEIMGGVGTTDPVAIAERLRANQARDQELRGKPGERGLIAQSMDAGPAGKEATQKLVEEQAALARSSQDAYEALEKLANSGDVAANILGKIEEERQQGKNVIEFVRKISTQSAEDAINMQRSFKAFDVIMKGGRLNREGRNLAYQGMDTILPLLKGSETGNKIIGKFTKQMLVAQGVDINKPNAFGSGKTLSELIDAGTTGIDPGTQKLIELYNQSIGIQQQAATELANLNGARAQQHLAGTETILNNLYNNLPMIIATALANPQGANGQAIAAPALKPNAALPAIPNEPIPVVVQNAQNNGEVAAGPPVNGQNIAGPINAQAVNALATALPNIDLTILTKLNDNVIRLTTNIGDLTTKMTDGSDVNKSMVTFGESVLLFGGKIDSFKESTGLFGLYVDKLSDAAGKLSDAKITMGGSYTVDVKVSGAAAFQAIEEGTQKLIDKQIGLAMGELVNKIKKATGMNLDLDRRG